MLRPYLTTPARRLLDLARESSTSITVLQAIVSELQERKNDVALEALIEVGWLLESAQAQERRQRQEQERARRNRQRRLRQAGYFEWPSTDAPASLYHFSGEHFSYKEGLLHFVGYRVGRNGTPQQIRLQILDCVFHNELPSVESPEYMAEWSLPKTAARLKKLAESVAAFTRNAKRNDGYDYAEAISEWESDLKYLYDEYYVGHFRFAWPSAY